MPWTVDAVCVREAPWSGRLEYTCTVPAVPCAVAARADGRGHKATAPTTTSAATVSFVARIPDVAVLLRPPPARWERLIVPPLLNRGAHTQALVRKDATSGA